MRISIITPNFNYGHFLSRAIPSVVAQVVQGGDVEVEHIVVDAGSTDESLDLLRTHSASVAASSEGSPLPMPTPDLSHRPDVPREGGGAERLGYRFLWISEPDRGQTHAINKGLRLATGDIVCWLNADEYYLPGSLSKVVTVFAKTPSVDFIYGEPLYVDVGDKPIRIKRDHPFSGFVLMWYGCYIASCCSFWRRRILDAGEFLDEGYKVIMDGEYWVRLMKLGYRFQFLPVNIAAFAWHDSNVSSLFNQRRLQEQERIKLLYASRTCSSMRLRKKFLALMNFVSHQWRRILVMYRLVFLPK